MCPFYNEEPFPSITGLALRARMPVVLALFDIEVEFDGLGHRDRKQCATRFGQIRLDGPVGIEKALVPALERGQALFVLGPRPVGARGPYGKCLVIVPPLDSRGDAAKRICPPL